MKNLVNYTISIIEPRIFAVVIKDQYERGMTFCRVQEFYESPSPKFRDKGFSIWDYMDWYAKNHHSKFSYPGDWSGFNLPVEIIVKCYGEHWMPLGNPGLYETPYDEILSNILADITIEVGSHNCLNGYIIGTDKIEGDLFNHEIRHAKYYTDLRYRKLVNGVTKRIKKGLPAQYKQLKKNVMEMGYAARVVDDEIQAYMQDRAEDPRFRKNIEISVLRSLKQIYIDALSKDN